MNGAPSAGVSASMEGALSRGDVRHALSDQNNWTYVVMPAVAAIVMAPMAHAEDDLQHAVATAVAGAVLSVAPGVHHVRLVLDQSMTLEGHPRAILDGDGLGDVARIRTAGVTLRNLILRNSVDVDDKGERIVTPTSTTTDHKSVVAA